ncbi:MAG TPA: hypothetical protein VK989_10455, partial [Polyangia bacterium]|nr:hypothetical protein [Polyangia bacterium]
ETCCDVVLGVLSKAIAESTADAFPLSISLMQFVVGVLLEGDHIPSVIGGYWTPVTAALRDLYPKTKEIKNAFDFELSY